MRELFCVVKDLKRPRELPFSVSPFPFIGIPLQKSKGFIRIPERSIVPCPMSWDDHSVHRACEHNKNTNNCMNIIQNNNEKLLNGRPLYSYAVYFCIVYGWNSHGRSFSAFSCICMYVEKYISISTQIPVIRSEGKIIALVPHWMLSWKVLCGKDYEFIFNGRILTALDIFKKKKMTIKKRKERMLNREGRRRIKISDLRWKISFFNSFWKIFLVLVFV